jgi:hypothetical protein
VLTTTSDRVVATAADRVILMAMPHSGLSDLMTIPWTSRHYHSTAGNGLTCMIPRQGVREMILCKGWEGGIKRQWGNIASNNTPRRKAMHRPWGPHKVGGAEVI